MFIGTHCMYNGIFEIVQVRSESIDFILRFIVLFVKRGLRFKSPNGVSSSFLGLNLQKSWWFNT